MNSVPDGEIFEVNPFDYPVMLMYSRSRSLFEACKILLGNNLPEEAMILARSLFEESVKLIELESLGKERRKYTAGWLEDSLRYKKGLIESKAKKDRLDPKNKKDMLDKLHQEERNLAEAKRYHSITAVRSLSSTDNLAQKHGLEKDHWAYLVGHQMTHGSSVAQAFRTKKSKVEKQKEVYMVYLKNSDLVLKGMCALLAMRSALRAQIATNSIMGWSTEENIHDLLKKLETF
jgi:hypothetical protein